MKTITKTPFRRIPACIALVLLPLFFISCSSSDDVNPIDDGVTQTDVYVAGEEYTGSGSVATLWKNGVAQSLTDDTQRSYAHSVFVVETKK